MPARQQINRVLPSGWRLWLASAPMSSPPEIRKLVDRFEAHCDTYLSGNYKETSLRRDFLDPFFKALGWDIDNSLDCAEAFRDVIHEDAIRSTASFFCGSVKIAASSRCALASDCNPARKDPPSPKAPTPPKDAPPPGGPFAFVYVTLTKEVHMSTAPAPNAKNTITKKLCYWAV